MTAKARSLKSSFAVSAAIHAAAFAAIGLLASQSLPPQGEGMITVELAGGEAGGYGTEQKDGRAGGAGAKGNAQKTTEAKPKAEVAAPARTEKAAPAPKAASAAPTSETGDVQVKETAKPAPLPQPAPEKAAAKTSAPEAKPAPRQSEKAAETPSAADGPGKDAKTEAKGTENGRAGAAGIGGGIGSGPAASGNGRGDGAGSGAGTGSGGAFGSGQFVANGDGTYTALNSNGIAYRIIHEEKPVYPRAARSIGYGNAVAVRVKFLVGLDGRVESAEVLTKNVPDLGFREAALTAIKAMRFEPIVYKGKNIKMYFRKKIIFQP